MIRTKEKDIQDNHKVILDVEKILLIKKHDILTLEGTVTDTIKDIKYMEDRLNS